MEFTNKIPETDYLRAVDEEYLDEIQARLDMGWRVKSDIQSLIDFARNVLETRRRVD